VRDLRFFLYRRLCRWISCDLRLPFRVRLSLASKYDVASFQDVFCHPFYWQVFTWLNEPPRLVVDCGANCGHFTALVETCVRVKFGRSDTRYLLVEPNPASRPILERNLRDAGVAGRHHVLTALLGSKSGSGTLWVHPKNYLASSLARLEGARPHTVPFVDLAAHLPETVDLLKMDIEGGEYAFARENPDVLERTRLLLTEIHDAPARERESCSSGSKEPDCNPWVGHRRPTACACRLGPAPASRQSRACRNRCARARPLVSDVAKSDCHYPGRRMTVVIREWTCACDEHGVVSNCRTHHTPRVRKKNREAVSGMQQHGL
jgi:FkbM family methyltransferase